jgi:hypothetical protein
MTEETQPTPQHINDRFDMEQWMLDCWKVTDDIKLYSERDVESKDWLALANYYEHKFDRLWNLFESMIQSGNIR